MERKEHNEASLEICAESNLVDIVESKPPKESCPNDDRLNGTGRRVLQNSRLTVLRDNNILNIKPNNEYKTKFPSPIIR
jgi:hypothetical protein